MSEIDRNGHPDGWGVVAQVQGAQDTVEIITGREGGDAGGEKRVVKIEGKPVKSQQELSRYVSMLWLIPAMDHLFTDTDSNRRKFLDRLVFTFTPDHASNVNRYEHAMRERNKLLEHAAFDPAWVGVLEDTMVEAGMLVAKARLETVEHLNHSIAGSTLSFPKARITLKGFAEDLLQQQVDAQEIASRAKAKLVQMRGVDAAAGRCLFGLHRCEMHTLFDTRATPAAQCSTGEQKALLLSIVLGQTRAVKKRFGVAPILLLDEVVAHLDASRRAELASAIMDLGSQAFLTGTDADFFTDFESRAQPFEVLSGKVQIYPQKTHLKSAV
jgi:DNA replication and repair protein RecF